MPEQVAATSLVCPLDDEQAVAGLFQRYGEQIAALIIEPLPANNGLLVQRPEFLRFLREITARYGALLIFDEVISGFRLHFGGYGQQLGIQPDLVTLGKIIGGGMPLGAVVGEARVLDLLAPLGRVYQAGTLSGNPLSLAAGSATLQLLQSGAVYEQLDTLGRRFAGQLAASSLPQAQVQRVGSILWLYLDAGVLPRRADAISPAAMQRFTGMYHALLEQGYYLPPSSYEVLFLSAAHSVAEIDGLAAAIIGQLKAGRG